MSFGVLQHVKQDLGQALQQSAFEGGVLRVSRSGARSQVMSGYCTGRSMTGSLAPIGNLE